MVKEQINSLIRLAAIDKSVAESEAKVIYTLGQLKGISKEEIDEMIKNPNPIVSVETMTEDEKFEHLYHLIQLMKSDGQVFKSEIHFCEKMAEKLGYKKGVVAELSSRIYGDPSITADRKLLKDSARKFLK